MNHPYRTVLLFILIGYFSFAQNVSESKIYETYDKIVSTENTGLYNGPEFIDTFLNTDGSYRYYNQFNFTHGNIVYSGQPYYNVPLKYDLLEDNVITHSEDNLSIFQVKLLPEKITAFSIYNHEFVRLTNTNLGLSGNGFFEVGYAGNDLSLYIKNIKKKRERPSSKGIQYSFSGDNFYLLKHQNKYFIVNSIKDVRKAIPEYEKQIRDFQKSYRNIYKQDTDGFMVKLVKYLDGLAQNIKQ